MKQRIIAALILAGFASASFAQDVARHYYDYNYRNSTPTVKDENSCPAGFYPTVPSYHYENGHFVGNGWVCESDFRDRG